MWHLDCLHAGVEAPASDGRSIRRSLNQTGRYTRQPRDDPTSQALMEEHGVGYSSTGLVAQMRDNGNAWQQGEVSVKLAKAYGYCWGVERAVRMAYEARQAFPTNKIYITNEIIHNPEVNQVWCATGARGSTTAARRRRVPPASERRWLHAGRCRLDGHVGRMGRLSALGAPAPRLYAAHSSRS